jgi:hypothetical protein
VNVEGHESILCILASKISRLKLSRETPSMLLKAF